MKYRHTAAWVCALALGSSSIGIAAPSTRPDARFLPPDGQTLLIIGQELQSVADYVTDCQSCATPGGVTTYLGFYDLLSAKDGFGGLGEDAAGNPAADADWGAGKTSAAKMLTQHPDSALVIGLDMSNGRRSGGLAEIARGVHDDKIARLAAFFVAAKRPVYLRIGYEFDGTWNLGYDDRKTYITAFRRIVDGLRTRGANNVAFVWQASASPLDDIIEQGRREDIRDWFPGASYVDWVALSWFLKPHAKGRANSLKTPGQLQLAREVIDFARAERKPVMIAESTPQGYDLGKLTHANISPLWDGPAGGNVVQLSAEQIWHEWYEPVLSFIDANRDVIAAFAYINANWDVQPMWAKPYSSGYWGDTRIQANPSIEKAWVTETRKPAWLHGGPRLYEILTSSRDPR
ncbi:hypothetical protein HNQ60_002383 [Povalibacter uvarum]|uniref:GH26 domain-containing protein n=1 Tax=Povalibacter uvarum TaxID=732238 RepID=A0A841HN48_9GAMM|nr:glycosyl hydrolase [Povalibacter uvarum]MBB6093502.1 hypothetical protein [Povalibacter uvarum]